MKKLIAIIVFALTTLGANAQDPRLEKANQLYAGGKFAESIEAYEGILQTGVENEVLYFNLGNAYYKTGKLPQAILNFERAKLLDPDDKDVNYNLELANSQITDRIDEVGEFFLITWIKGLIDKGSSDFWAWMAICSFILVLGGAGVFLYSSNGGLKKVGFFSAIALAIVCILSFSFSYRHKQKSVNRTEAIVFAPNVNVKSSPDSSGTDLFVIHEGTKVKILEKLGTWRKVQLKDGSQGWMEASGIEVI